MRGSSFPIFVKLTLAVTAAIVAVLLVLFIVKIALLAAVAAVIVIGAAYAARFVQRLKYSARLSRSVTTYRR